jgi:hypothetical protein
MMPVLCFGQTNTTNNIVVGGESNGIAIVSFKENGMTYMGKGVYEISKTGGSAFIRTTKLRIRCEKQIKNFTTQNNLTYKEINKEITKAGIGIYPNATITYQTYNKDGSIYTTSSDKSSLKEEAKKQLLELKKLKDQSIITQEEYNKAAAPHKKILLGL